MLEFINHHYHYGFMFIKFMMYGLYGVTIGFTRVIIYIYTLLYDWVSLSPSNMSIDSSQHR